MFTDLVVATPIFTTTAQVGAGAGADAPAHAQAKAAELTALLVARDAGPAGWRYDAHTLFFDFYTPFRRNRALEILPPSYMAGNETIFVQTALVDTPAVVGQIVGTAQETPWTCGPAALRAVLAHYGRDVSEAEVERAASNGPAIGARPEGMVRAAEVYGCHARAFMMNGVGELVALLAKGIPPIVIVDSWTRPGKVGHYVVVSKVDTATGLVTVMDPHTEGNWRVMTAREFDERWWAKRRGKDGEPVVIRRVCVVVTPGEGMVVVGADKSPVVAPAVVLPVVRGDIPSPRVMVEITKQVERLIRNSMGPLWVEHKIDTVSAGTITFVFATGFRAGRAGELLPAGLRIEGRALRIRTRVFDPDVELGAVGDAIWPALRAVIDKYKAKLAASNVAPVEVEYDWRTVTFVYSDVASESVVKAGELLPGSEEVDGKRIYFKTRTIGRDLDVGAGVGGDAVAVTPPSAPTHGRTAKIKGASKGMKTFAKVAQFIGKAVITFFTGGAGGKAYDALLDVTGSNVAKMKPNEKAAWFNDASNPEMYMWALAQTRDNIKNILDAAVDPKNKDHKKALDYGAIVDVLGLTRSSIGNLRTAMIPALKMHLWYYAMRQGKNKWGWIGVPRNDDQWHAHALQAILILFYDGLANAWPIIKAAVKGRPKLDWNDAKSAGAVARWVDSVVAALEPHRTVPEGADNPNLTIDDVPAEPALVISAPASPTASAPATEPPMLVATEVQP
jgi:hypothetical protein